MIEWFFSRCKMVDKYNDIKGPSDAAPELTQPIVSLQTHFNAYLKPEKRVFATSTNRTVSSSYTIADVFLGQFRERGRLF
jgi:hypothetical protein